MKLNFSLGILLLSIIIVSCDAGPASKSEAYQNLDNKSQIKQLIESERLQLKQIIESTIQQSENSINDNIVKHSELQSKAMNTLKWSIWIIGFISIILLALITFKNFQ